MNKIINDTLITHQRRIAPDEVKPINVDIRSYIEHKETVDIDCSGVEMMTTAFRNIVIGDLYKDYTSEELREFLTLSNLTEGDARRIKRVTDTAKLFYKNRAIFTNSVNDLLDGKA